MHYDEKKKEIHLIIFFLFFVLYGFYKNGLTYYLLGKLSFWKSLKPLFYPILGVLLKACITCYKKRKVLIKKEDILLGMLLGILMPPEFPILPYSGICLLFLFVYNFLKQKMPIISWICVWKCFVIVLTNIMSIGLENQIEKTTPYLYGTMDTFFGKSVGTVGATSIFFMILLYIFLVNQFYYKKELPIYSYITYCILFLGVLLFVPNQLEIKDILNSSLMFLSICILPINENTPVSISMQRIYGVLVGLLSFVFIHLFSISEGAYLGLLCVNVLWAICYKFWVKKLMNPKK